MKSCRECQPTDFSPKKSAGGRKNWLKSVYCKIFKKKKYVNLKRVSMNEPDNEYKSFRKKASNETISKVLLTYFTILNKN